MNKTKDTTSYRPKLMTKPNTKMAGLTLVESLVAISILVIAVFGPMSIVSQAIRTAYLTRDQTTAFYLAQEAIEHVRNIRDRNSLAYDQSDLWLYYLDQGQTPEINEEDESNPLKYHMVLGTVSTANPTGYTLLACSLNNPCPKLNIDTVTRHYGAPTVTSTIVPSIYTRQIAFYKVPNDNPHKKEVVVEVIVKWSQAGGNYQYKVREHLRNWKMVDE